MKFIKTNAGLVNLAFVERIDRSHEGKAILHLNDRSPVSEMSFEDLEEELGEIVPNFTTSQALFMEVVEGEVQHYLMPIIAWRMTSVGALPILSGGDECSFVLLPSGQVDEPLIGMFNSLDEAKAAFLARGGA